MEDTNKDYLMKIKEIEAFIDSGKATLIGTVVNTKAINKHLEELKEIINTQLSQAQNVLDREQDILREAELEAESMIERTRREIMSQDIAQQAEDYARNIVLDAQDEVKEKITEARDLRQKMLISSHKYLENLFTDVEQQLIEQQRTIASNRDEIRDSLKKKIEMMDKLPN